MKDDLSEDVDKVTIRMPLLSEEGRGIFSCFA